MRISFRRCAILIPGVLLACSAGSSKSNSNSSSNSSSSSSSSRNSGGGGGCGGGGGVPDSASDVKGAPTDDGRGGGPTDPAPTGQSWKPVETDEGCGRTGVSWVLVDETCGDGEGNDDGRAFYAPMFRDGAILGQHLYAVDASHLWSLDLSKPVGEIARSALLTGVGQPLAVDTRGTELVMAAGHEGLVLVDTKNPGLPTRSRSLPFAGSAFDVSVAKDTAYVALGHAGIAEVDSSTPSPTLKHRWPIAGFSAGVTTRDGYAYVAACSTMRVVDLSTGNVVAETWVPQPFVGKRLMAPAKKVTLVGDVAFVAAGRFGAVALDVSTPTSPKLIGNCTRTDGSFYVSGVRANADKLFVAAGEWGVLPVDVTTPKSACPTLSKSPAPPANDTECSSAPPWEVVPWQKIWDPPPPSKDPIQTLPVGDRVYAFGDARRIGTRAIDVRDATTITLPLVDRYDEPRALLGIAANGSRVIAVGPRGGVFTIDAQGNLARTITAEDEVLRASTQVTMLADGRWAALEAKGVRVEGRADLLQVTAPTAIAASAGASIAVATATRIQVIDVDSGSVANHPIAKTARLPLSLAADANGVYFAAPEWTSAVKSTSAQVSLESHDVFDADDIMDSSLWRVRLPRRHLVSSSYGVVEIAGLGPSVGLVVHGASGKKKTSLFPMTYSAAASDGDHVYVVGLDRSVYRSYLLSVSIGGGVPNVVSLESFTGGASGVAASNGRVFVADADGAIRVYAISAAGVAVPAATVQVSP